MANKSEVTWSKIQAAGAANAQNGLLALNVNWDIGERVADEGQRVGLVWKHYDFDVSVKFDSGRYCREECHTPYMHLQKVLLFVPHKFSSQRMIPTYRSSVHSWLADVIQLRLSCMQQAEIASKMTIPYRKAYGDSATSSVLCTSCSMRVWCKTITLWIQIKDQWHFWPDYWHADLERLTRLLLSICLLFRHLLKGSVIRRAESNRCTNPKYHYLGS